MTDTASKPDRIYLVDGSGYIFRAFHALPPLTRSDGTPVNAVLGFCNMLLKLIEDAEADYIAVIFDAGRQTFRNEIYPEYKAHRPEAPPELIPQFALIREATRAFNVPALETKGFEADDLIATYASQAAARGLEVTIVSSDKDLMQLVGDGISLFDPMKNRKIGPDEVREKFGVAPDKVVDVQALAGDSSDNVPGVPGIGIKTAAELITTYGDLDTLLARAGEIKQPKRRENLVNNAELARISRDLVTLKRDAPIEVPLDNLAKRGIQSDMILPFLQQNEFRSLAAKVQSRLGEAALKASRSGATAGTLAAAAAAPSVQIDADPAVFSGGYELVQEEAQLVSWMARARAAGSVAFDIETNSLNIIEAKLVGMSFAVAANAACYVPLGHEGIAGDLLGGATERPKQIPLERALALVKPLLEDPSVLKVGHNIKYDMAVMQRHGIVVAPLDDSMLISYVLGGGAHNHGMDDLAKQHFDHDTIKFNDVAGSGKSQVTFDLVPLDKALAYAAEDADVTWRLHHLLKPRLVAERLLSVYETIERPLIPVIAGMELAGVKIDAAELGRMSQDFAGRMAEIENEIHELAGSEFNVGSPKQLGEVLFDQLKLRGGKKGKTGAYATGADILEELATTSGHPLPQKVLDWRQLSKLKSTYTDALPLAIRPETGRVHTSFALAHTSTGRIASTDPNLQNIPIRTEEGRKIRRAFVAEPGHVVMSVDYSQIELRLAAEMADIQALKDAFRDGADIHAITASQVFGVPVEGMDPMVRRQAKAINFGIIYGISAFGLAQQLGIPQGEAKTYIEAYFKRYPGIRDYMERMKTFAREKGYVETLFGRRCHVPGINDKNPARRSFMERAAINAPLQGTAADIIKRAMIRMPGALAAAGLKGRMLLQVHDELLFEVPKAEVEATGAIVKKVMEEAPLPARHISVPIIAEVGTGPNWAEAH